MRGREEHSCNGRESRAWEDDPMQRILFRDVSLLDGTGRAPFPAEVLIEGNRIRTVAPAGAGLAAADADVVDGAGATLMPGLVEAHAHPGFANTETQHALGEIPPEEHTLITAKFARLLLDHGFTSLFSAASAKPRLDVVVRNAIRAGDLVGPRMLAASPEMTVTGGLGDVSLAHLQRGTFGDVADGADAFRKLARFYVREGVDTLKINPSGDEAVPSARARHTVMTEDEVAAVCEVARSREKRVAAHARSAEAVKMSLRNGVEVIYHATLCDAEALDMLEAAKDRVFVGPAIGIIWASLMDPPGRAGLPGTSADALERELEAACRVMNELRRRGVRILPGGDYGFARNPMPRNARDLEHFVNLFGFSPMGAIETATRLGGELMGQGDELGQVREGFLADLLLVDGDPLKDLSILQDADRLLAIVLDGRFHKRSANRAQRRAAAE